MDVRFYPSAMAPDTSLSKRPRGGGLGWTAGLAAVILATAVVPKAAGEGRRFAVDAARSRIVVKVGTAGLFRFAGHDHVVEVRFARGEVVGDPEDPGKSSVWLSFETAAVRVVSSEGPADEIPKVQEKMAGPVVLDVARFPESRFSSRRVSGHVSKGPGLFDLVVEGELTLRGTTKPVVARVAVELRGPSLVARGQVRLKQTDFGIEPVSVAGLVKVKNELLLELEIVAAAEEGK
jgi:polyisoprenoid-binding protein YceI